MDSNIMREEEEAATEFPSPLKLLTKKTRIFGNNAHARERWHMVMTERPPPLAKREERHREEILERLEEGWQAEEWATSIPQRVNELLLRNLCTTRTSLATRTDRAADGIQWIRMEELGKAITNRCRAFGNWARRDKRQRWEPGTNLVLKRALII